MSVVSVGGWDLVRRMARGPLWQAVVHRSSAVLADGGGVR
jgi:hypothetical protein